MAANKLSDIQFYRHKTTAIRTRRVFQIKALDSWLTVPRYSVYAYMSKPYSFVFRSRGKSMASIHRRLGK